MRNVATKADGTTSLAAGDWNATQDELENIVTSTGQSLDPAGGADTDLNMLGKAVADYAGAAWGYTDSGTANAHVVAIASTLKSPHAYLDNQIVSYLPGNTQTTAAVTVNVATLGVKSIKMAGGANPGIGRIKSTVPIIIKYNSGAGYFELVSGFTPSGAVVQTVITKSTGLGSGTTVLPVDDSIPQNTEGDEYITQAITPTAAANTLVVETVMLLANSASAAAMAVALFQDSTAGALAATHSHTQDNANTAITISMQYSMAAGTTSSTTFKIRAGANVGGTTSFNGQNASRLWGGVAASFLKITELQA